MTAPWILAGSQTKLSFVRKPPREAYWGFHPTPLGYLFIATTEDSSICIITFSQGRGKQALLAAWQKKWVKTQFIEDQKKSIQVIYGLFDKAEAFSVCMVGTEFQHAVWKTIAAIQRGTTLSYADLAQKIRKPRAIRAVGTACGANPVPVLVPCHRVVGSDGSLGGFAGGLPLKRKMLATEAA